MVLVDSSVWIEYLGRGVGAVSDRLDAVIASGEPIAVTGLIVQEVLQGARSPSEFTRLREHLELQRLLEPLDPVASYVAAAALYRRCRAAGVTPRSSTDCLIAQIAIEHNARLLHHDSDFNQMARVIRSLSIV